MFFRRKRAIESTGQIFQDLISNLKPASATKYAALWRDWTSFLGSKDPLKATESDAARFFETLRNRPSSIKGTAGEDLKLSNRTLGNKSVILSGVYTKLLKRGLVKRDPFVEIQERFGRFQISDRRPTELFPFELIRSVLDAPIPNTPEGVRDSAYFVLLFYCGLRISEIRNLKLADVKLGSMTGAPEFSDVLFVRLKETKAGVDDEQIVPQLAMPALMRLVTQRSSEGAGIKDALFVSYFKDWTPKKALDSRGLRVIFQNWLKRLGIHQRLSPHSARATAITYLLEEKGLSHRQVQKFSRHSSVRTVELYDKLRLKKDVEISKAVDF